MQKQKVPIGYELWNNIGVLRHKLKKHHAAEEAYQAALNVYYAEHVCRLKEWPQPIQTSFEEMQKDPTVYHLM